MRVRKGTLPKDANGIIGDNEESGWVIYRRAASAAPWVSLKIVHAEPIKGPANYWLGWHATERRFAHSGDVARLEAYRPDLLEWIREIMTELYPTLTEEDMRL